jgi:16S rRNA processing protein RimM
LSEDEAAGRGPEGQVVLAAVAGAHGVKGEVRLKLFAESVESLQRHTNVEVGGRTLRLQGVKPGKNVVARFSEISDRTAAEGLRGSLVSVPRSALPPLEPGEYYYTDLVGLSCENSTGELLGTVVGVENFGAGDILEIEQPDGKRSMVPFREGIADLGDGRIIVDPEFLA